MTGPPRRPPHQHLRQRPVHRLHQPGLRALPRPGKTARRAVHRVGHLGRQRRYLPPAWQQDRHRPREQLHPPVRPRHPGGGRQAAGDEAAARPARSNDRGHAGGVYAAAALPLGEAEDEDLLARSGDVEGDVGAGGEGDGDAVQGGCFRGEVW